jgi:Skp family chaperone for outer membrane proteins
VNEFINLNDQISELRIWCYYLKNNKMEFHSPNQKAVVNFDYLINEIDLLAEKIKNNFENVYEGVKTELDDIAREVKYYVEHQYID